MYLHLITVNYNIWQVFQSLLDNEFLWSLSSASTMLWSEVSSLTVTASRYLFSSVSLSLTLLFSISSPTTARPSFSFILSLPFCLLACLECLKEGSRLPAGPLARVLFGAESCSDFMAWKYEFARIYLT